MQYDDDDLAAVGIKDPAQLNLLRWSGEGWEKLLPCSGCALDVQSRTVSIVLAKLGEFALAAPGRTGFELYLPHLGKELKARARRLKLVAAASE